MSAPAFGALVFAITIASAVAIAQRFDPNRPLTLTVGRPPGAATTDGVDARRSGFARSLLPTGTLRLAWHHALPPETEHAPLVLSDGSVVVLTARGDVVTLSPDGDERLHVSAGVGAPGPGAVLSDGTIVLVNLAGEAVGIRGEAVRFRTHVVERGLLPKAAPLALEDGGVVVAAGTRLAALDADGELRAATTLPEPIAWPLLSALGKVMAIGPSGTVYAWSPGREPMRVGSFGAAVEGGAAAADEHTLVAVVGGTRLSALDLVHGIAVTRAVASGGLWLGPPAIRGTTAVLLELLPTNLLAVAIDPAGQELMRSIVATFPPPLADGGTPQQGAIPPRMPILVDAAGTVAFETTDGRIGIVTATGDVETLGDLVCTRETGRRAQAQPAAAHPSRSLAGLAPAGRGAFIVGCAEGQVAKVSGDD